MIEAVGEEADEGRRRGKHHRYTEPADGGAHEQADAESEEDFRDDELHVPRPGRAAGGERNPVQRVADHGLALTEERDAAGVHAVSQRQLAVAEDGLVLHDRVWQMSPKHRADVGEFRVFDRAGRSARERGIAGVETGGTVVWRDEALAAEDHRITAHDDCEGSRRQECGHGSCAGALPSAAKRRPCAGARLFQRRSEPPQTQDKDQRERHKERDALAGAGGERRAQDNRLGKENLGATTVRRVKPPAFQAQQLLSGEIHDPRCARPGVSRWPRRDDAQCPVSARRQNESNRLSRARFDLRRREFARGSRAIADVVQLRSAGRCRGNPRLKDERFRRGIAARERRETEKYGRDSRQQAARDEEAGELGHDGRRMEKGTGVKNANAAE